MKPKTNAGYSALPLLFLILSWVFALPGHGFGADSPAEDTGNLAHYVGSESCAGCHPEEHDSFTRNAKKAHSYQNLIPLKDKLTAAEFAECCACHTTGYGKPGGFVSFEKTPQMSNLGCESCHGPGGAHIESEDSDDIIARIDVDSCTQCHNHERVEAFDFKPMLYGGAH